MRKPLYENGGPAPRRERLTEKQGGAGGDIAAPVKATPRMGVELSEDELRHVLRLRSMRESARQMLLTLGESHARDFPAEEPLPRTSLRLVLKGD